MRPLWAMDLRSYRAEMPLRVKSLSSVECSTISLQMLLIVYKTKRKRNGNKINGVFIEMTMKEMMLSFSVFASPLSPSSHLSFSSLLVLSYLSSSSSQLPLLPSSLSSRLV